LRRILSFCFAILILFNTVGHVYVLNWYHHELDRKAEELIDEHVSEISGNLIFTLPVAMPDALSSTEYTRVDGEIKFEGHLYRMVKQKVQGTLLYIVCVRDDRMREVDEQVNEIIAAVSGQATKDPSATGAKVLSSLLKYCDISSLSGDPGSERWMQKFVFANHEDNYRYNSTCSHFHPPGIS